MFWKQPGKDLDETPAKGQLEVLGKVVGDACWEGNDSVLLYVKYHII